MIFYISAEIRDLRKHFSRRAPYISLNSQPGSHPMIKALFLDHPATVDETYAEHLTVAGGFAVRLLAGGLACLVHAVFPFLFVKTGSAIIEELHDRMVVNRQRRG
jgi:hypothetical protein